VRAAELVYKPRSPTREGDDSKKSARKEKKKENIEEFKIKLTKIYFINLREFYFESDVFSKKKHCFKYPKGYLKSSRFLEENL
jgi:hypothetical protein